MKKLIAVLLLASFAFAAPKDLAWQTGKLVNSESEHGQKLASAYNWGNGTTTFHHKRNDATYYMIETDTMVYVAKRTLTSRYDKQLDITENAPVKFGISGQDLYLLDDKGKEHKLSIEKKAAK